MIYNLHLWIKTQFPSLPIYTNGFDPTSPDDGLEMNEGPGEDQSLWNRQDTVVQFVSRAKTKPNARENAINVYNYIAKRIGECILPAVTVDSVVYPALSMWAVRPVSKPQYVGDDTNGRHLFSFSVEITTDLSTIQ
jgi:hypothetical protein